MTLSFIPAVALIVDEEFGAKLGAFVSMMPVWIIESPSNALAVASLPSSAQKNVAMFTKMPGETPFERLWRGVSDIEDHEGPNSGKSFGRLIVFGASRELLLPQELRFFSYSTVEEHADRFELLKQPSP
ncbi:MAG: hypothetical protein IPJ65_07845 [Archangiaceae bacterium]|nr:hypothetical protein [Archangiaceae bacterium]